MLTLSKIHRAFGPVFANRRLFLLLSVAALLTAGTGAAQEPEILVFSKTLGWRHDSIPAGRDALVQLGRDHGFRVDTTENASWFTDRKLAAYDAVIFLNTTLNVLDEYQQVALMRYIQAGGGFVGIHSAADTEYEWPWYGQLVGAYFVGHPGDPNVRQGALTVVGSAHGATGHLPTHWVRRDEWYDYRYVNPNTSILLSADETSYKRRSERPSRERHPISWYHEFDGGRSFYTGLGHTIESFSEPAYLRHLLGGIRYAIGDNVTLDYSLPGVRPELDQFKKVILEDNLNEPMELDLLPDGRIIYVERPGRVRIYSPVDGKTTTAGSLQVTTQAEDGLLGVAVDPDYAKNRWIYLIYSPADGPARQYVSRFRLDGDRLDLSSERIMLRIPLLREGERAGCCHSGGSLEFDSSANLYVSLGDNTNPFESDGAAPIDERPGRSSFDAQKSASNAADLRGKILRVHPEADGTYSIPAGNLFPKDGSVGRPEIYTMGNRNPFRISIDSKTGYLFWGEVGPDAGRDSTVGPKGYDEINRATAAGNFGWPYAIADNLTYRDRDFETGDNRDYFDCVAPSNDSPNNTGPRQLPPCRPAWIYYPYDASVDFPLVGIGGRTAMAGPVYRFADANPPPGLPPYFEGRLFVYEWMRDWISTVRLDGRAARPLMESFMPDTEFSRPMDMVIDENGVMYLLEYGDKWNSQNPDARLSRIEYSSDPARDSDSGSDPVASTVEVAKPASEAGHQDMTGAASAATTSVGQLLIQKSDCRACHSLHEALVGPSFMAISERYRGQDGALEMLANKVQSGGSGVWGQQPMIPHPQHSNKEILAMVEYILSLRDSGK